MVGRRLLQRATCDRRFGFAAFHQVGATEERAEATEEPTKRARIHIRRTSARAERLKPASVLIVEVMDALAVLGLRPPCAWDDVRQAYRDRLMASHPDTADTDGSAEQTEAVVAAFRALRTLTEDGLLPLPYQPGEEDDGIGPMVLYARPGDVFARMCQAADEIGHLSYADRDANLLQVTIASEEWAPSQLTAELTAEGEVTTALFSLEALGTQDAPPIAEVVARLADQLKAPAAID